MAKDIRSRGLWSPRRFLLRVHEDLLKIHYWISPTDFFPEDGLSPLERMVIVLEDRKFFSHKGIHWKAVLREVVRLLTFRRVRGASTIDIQFVRTIIDRHERTIKRKIYEALLANLIQYRYSKITILRSYMAVAYLGWNMRGFFDLSYADFGIDPTEVSGFDAARLASHLVFPRPREINSEWERKILRRANYIYPIYLSRKKYFQKLERRIF